MAQEEGKDKEMDSAYSYMSIFYSPVHKSKVRRVDLKFYPYQDRAYVSIAHTLPIEQFFGSSLLAYLN